MTNPKFPKLIDYESLKHQLGDDVAPPSPFNQMDESSNLIFEHNSRRPIKDQDTLTEPSNHMALDTDDTSIEKKQRPGLTGTRLRSYAFAVLTRKEYSKQDLLDKLSLYAESREEVIALVEELARENYQSDQRVAEMVVRSQIRKGKGPNRIKLALSAKKIDKSLAQDDMQEIDWYEQAYQLKIKKYGLEVATDPKIKAKQIRFLQYRGFEMDAIMKAIRKKPNDED